MNRETRENRENVLQIQTFRGKNRFSSPQEPRNADTRESVCKYRPFASFAPFAVKIGFHLILLL
jgi:hypothetical protein